MSYVVGDNSGELTTTYSRLIIQYNDYRAEEDPEFEFTYAAQVLDSLVESHRIVIVADVTDPAGSVTERYTFRKVPITVVQAAPEDETRQVWVLQSSVTLNPGEVSFE